jgi:hypothetical protein
VTLGTSDSVSVKIFLVGNELRATMPYKNYVELSDLLKSDEISDSATYRLSFEKGAETILRLDRIQGLEMKPTGVRALSRRQGVTIKEIAKVMGCSYVTLVRKINKPGGIQLTLSSDRRVEMTEENFANLNLSKQQINELKVIERKRTGSS